MNDILYAITIWSNTTICDWGSIIDENIEENESANIYAYTYKSQILIYYDFGYRAFYIKRIIISTRFAYNIRTTSESAQTWKDTNLNGIDPEDIKYNEKSSFLLRAFVTWSRLNIKVRDYLPKYVDDKESQLTFIIRAHEKGHWGIKKVKKPTIIYAIIILGIGKNSDWQLY